MGVRLVNVGEGGSVVSVTRNPEVADEGEIEPDSQGLGSAPESV